MRRRNLPGNAKQRKAISKLAATDIRAAVALLIEIDPGARRIYFRPATADNIVPRK